MVQNKSFLTILPVVAVIIICSSIVSVHGQANGTVNVRFDIQVYDVNLSSDIAQVNVTISFQDLFMEGLHQGVPIRAIVISDIDHTEILCNESSYGDFSGSSGIIPWALTGNLAKGEFFPFDVYELNFSLANVLPGPFNMSKVVVTLDSTTSLEGNGKLLLSRIFNTMSVENRLLLETNFFSGNPEVIVHLNRILGPLHYPVFFWQLILPIMAGYWLLAATLILSGEKSRGDRLTVSLSLFFFCPTFLLAIQGYLPLRATLSFPEVLIVTLVTSTAIFAFFSLFTAKDCFKEVIKDGIMLWTVSVSTLYLLTSLLPLFPAPAFGIITYGVLWPYLIVALILWTLRFLNLLFLRFASKKERILTFIGGEAAIIGLLFSMLWTISTYLFIVGVVLLGVGILLIVLVKRFRHLLEPSSFVGFGMAI